MSEDTISTPARDTSFGGLMAERSGFVVAYNGICEDLQNVPNLYESLEDLAASIASLDAEIAAAAAAEGVSLAGFAPLQKPVKVEIKVPQVKASEARTERLRWILSQNRAVTAADFHDICIKTGRAGSGNAYATLCLYFRDGYLVDNGVRGQTLRAFSVNTENAHVKSWLGL